MAAAFVLQGGWPLLAARLTFVAALVSLGGTQIFGIAVAPSALARADPTDTARVHRALTRLTSASLALAFTGLFAWSGLQTAQFVGADGLRPALTAFRPVLTGTSFGHVVIGQAIFLFADALLLAIRWRRAALAAALAAIGCQAGHGHSAAAAGLLSLLAALDLIHLLAASVWIGGLLPLLLTVQLTHPRTGAAAARWFSPIGKWAVACLVAAALLQAAWLVGSLHALRTTAYGTMVLVKATLFTVLLVFAVLNRYALAPALRGVTPEPARRRVAASIAMQTTVGLFTVTAASILSGLPPGDAP